ncbi:SMI1/KNR4 family protein [Lysinibacillus sp. Bpr_S20]|uniref:SMI1/KNR4 family protein n=1 Tax=Lysinibacillus sp. Bpr_S20 TaxID=2933964 RepID=UPI002012599F|nr:SMI1/KNR4 family protein [Lysinibacillus sp. Bpr_S20]MCL1701848.1 SMI1/KNR4 family protein [Lysinibacillus sp. Bpr_S20]
MDIRAYIKNGFEVYYERYNQVSEEGFCRWMCPDVPEEMKVVDIDGEWSVWRMIPSTVTEEDIQALEKEFGLHFPEWYKAFISTYHHYFGVIPDQSIEDPLNNVRDMFNPTLCSLGYLPFSWDTEYGKIICIDLNNNADEDNCAIYEIEHEILFDDGADIQSSLDYLYPNFKAYFDDTFLESNK